MHRQTVTSSNLHSVGYDPQMSVLEIEFRGGRIYQYSNVSTRVYEGLMNSSSHGRYFHQHIRDIYQYKRIV